MPDEQPATKPGQFSLRLILLITTLIAAYCALVFTASVEVRFFGEILLPFLFGAVLTTAITFGSDGVRAFSIGAIFPPGVMLFAIGIFVSLTAWDELPVPSDLGSAAVSVVWIPLSLALGYICWLVKRYAL
jgi:hypothetical protein